MPKKEIVFECGGPNFAGEEKQKLITLEQETSGRHRYFTLTYGKQVTENMSYSRACTELGMAILHALCCDSKASNEGT